MATKRDVTHSINTLKSILNRRGMPGRIKNNKRITQALTTAEEAIAAVNTAIEERYSPAKVGAITDQAMEAAQAAWEVFNDAQWQWGCSVAARHSKQLAALQEKPHFELWSRWDADLCAAHQATSQAVRAAYDYDGKPEGLLALCQRNFGRLNAVRSRYDAIREAGGLRVAVTVSGDTAEWEVGVDGEVDGFRLRDLVGMTDEQILAADSVGPKTLAAIRERIPAPTVKDQAAAAAAENAENGRSIGARARITTE